MANTLNKYPYHKALSSIELGLSSWTKGYFRACYYKGYKLGKTNADINHTHFSTATRRGWEAGYKEYKLLKLLTGAIQ